MSRSCHPHCAVPAEKRLALEGSPGRAGMGVSSPPPPDVGTTGFPKQDLAGGLRVSDCLQGRHGGDQGSALTLR